MIMIVYEYTIDSKSSMENPDWSELVPTYLCDNPRRSSQKESVPDLKFFIIVWNVMLFLDFPPIMCWSGTHMMSLGRTPVLWWYRPILSPGRSVCMYSTFYVSWTLGIPCLPSVCGCCCSSAHIISCRTWCHPSAGCVFVYYPLWGLFSPCMT